MDEQLEKAIEVVRAATGFEGGAEIKTRDLFASLGFEWEPARIPGESMSRYLSRRDRHRLEAVGRIAKLRERLLREYQVDLQATHRSAYQVVPSGVQATRAEKDSLKEVRKALRKAAERIENVAVAKLTHEEKVSRDWAMLNTAARRAAMSAKSVQEELMRRRKPPKRNDGEQPPRPGDDKPAP